MDALTQWIRDTLGPPLGRWHGVLDDWIATLPEWSGRAAAAALFVSAALWAFTLKRQYIYLGAPDQAAWRDLRWWAALALIPYVLIYLWL